MTQLNSANLDFSQMESIPHLGQVYNALDCCLTIEVHQNLQPLFNESPIIYDFERALQAPALEMMLRGIRIDQFARAKAVNKLDNPTR